MPKLECWSRAPVGMSLTVPCRLIPKTIFLKSSPSSNLTRRDCSRRLSRLWNCFWTLLHFDLILWKRRTSCQILQDWSCTTLHLSTISSTYSEHLNYWHQSRFIWMPDIFESIFSIEKVHCLWILGSGFWDITQKSDQKCTNKP